MGLGPGPQPRALLRKKLPEASSFWKAGASDIYTEAWGEEEEMEGGTAPENSKSRALRSRSDGVCEPQQETVLCGEEGRKGTLRAGGDNYAGPSTGVGDGGCLSYHCGRDGDLGSSGLYWAL